MLEEEGTVRGGGWGLCRSEDVGSMAEGDDSIRGGERREIRWRSSDRFHRFAFVSV